MTDLATCFPLLVDDEFRLLAELAVLSNAQVLDIGCGAGQSSARMASEGHAARVVGIEVDEIQLEKNRAGTWPPGVEFRQGAAESLGFADTSFDGATFFKSLHHVPVAAMDQALGEVHRTLRAQGWLYVSEPVFAGPLNEVVRLFHDEGAVRAGAAAATARAVDAGLFGLERRVDFFTPVRFRDFEDFRARMMAPTHSRVSDEQGLVQRVRQAYDAHQTPHGASFIRPMRVELLRKR